MTERYFFIIGAQKAGTTALFEYLRHHPQIYMPPEKEIDFFTSDTADAPAWAQYLARYLIPNHTVVIAGTASPHYMCDMAVPERMAAIACNARLIAILRDPIARAVSHYKMCRRRGDEKRDFAKAIEEQLAPEALQHMRGLSMQEANECDAYVAWGEYARILKEYLGHFPREQLLILYSEDLRDHRQETLESVLRHLGVDETYEPPNLSREFHVGGPRRKIRGLDKTMRSFIVRGLLRLVISKRRYKSLQLALERWNVKSGKIPVSAATCALLEAHYKPDVEDLARLTGKRPEWFKYARDGPTLY